MKFGEYYRENVSEDITKNPNFISWFKGSKVIDKNGNPLIVYHGTNKYFKSFDPNTIGKNYHESVGGFFFTSRKKSAESYANLNSGEPNILSVYLSIKSPYIDDAIDYWDAVDKFDRNPNYIIMKAKEKDNDGVIINSPTGSLYIAFNSNQIKSVDNNGSFSKSSGNIYEGNYFGVYDEYGFRKGFIK